MFAYYVRMALLSIRKNWWLSLLMVAAIALGIGVCMTIVTVNYIMGSDPIPQKSEVLHYVQLDSWDPNDPYDEPNEPPDQLTYLDAMALMDAKAASRQTATAGASMVLRPEDPDINPFLVSTRTSFADFFPMFDVPFLYGSGWSAEEDDNRSLVMVLSKETNERLFGGENSVGRTVSAGGHVFTIVGVIDDWDPIPRFYDVTTGPFNDVEDTFVPFNLIVELDLSRSGNTNCWKPTGDGVEAFLNSECIWIQFWAELPDPTAQREYLSYLDQYVTEQKALGRFERPLNNRISDVNAWLDNQQVVQDEARILLVVAVLFLAVCLLNTIGLLLSKYLSRAPEIGLRRALGASRSAIFTQYTIESALIGVAGGVIGIAMTFIGLKGVRALFGEVVENLVHMDWVMVVSAVALAIVASILAGLYPAIRACNIQPASQLKAQ